MVENINRIMSGAQCSRGFYSVGVQHVWNNYEGEEYVSFAQKIKDSNINRKVTIVEPLMVDAIDSLKAENKTQFISLESLVKEGCFKDIPVFVLPLEPVRNILGSVNNSKADYVIYIP